MVKESVRALKKEATTYVTLLAILIGFIVGYVMVSIVYDVHPSKSDRITCEILCKFNITEEQMGNPCENGYGFSCNCTNTGLKRVPICGMV